MNSPSLPAVERLDVQAFINAQPLSPYQWRIVLLCFLIVFLDGLVRESEINQKGKARKLWDIEEGKGI
ncbi:hypothetical protein I5G13_20790 [Pseudomonas aeruginosa]|nr:hypothetical protein [Pseudomonas aeruginosa]